MADKSIIITEKELLKRIDEMCAESLSPDIYSMWIDKIVPQLNGTRLRLKDKKVGMYGDIPHITIGEFIMCEQSDPPGESIWIEHVGEDGGEFRKDFFEKVLKEYYDKNF